MAKIVDVGRGFVVTYQQQEIARDANGNILKMKGGDDKVVTVNNVITCRAQDFPDVVKVLSELGFVASPAACGEGDAWGAFAPGSAKKPLRATAELRQHIFMLDTATETEKAPESGEQPASQAA